MSFHSTFLNPKKKERKRQTRARATHRGTGSKGRSREGAQRGVIYVSWKTLSSYVSAREFITPVGKMELVWRPPPPPSPFTRSILSLSLKTVRGGGGYCIIYYLNRGFYADARPSTARYVLRFFFSFLFYFVAVVQNGSYIVRLIFCGSNYCGIGL